MRELLRDRSDEALDNLFALMAAGDDAHRLAAYRLWEAAAWGKQGPEGIGTRAAHTVRPPATDVQDLGAEIKHARRRLADITEQLVDAPEEALPALARAEGEASDLVRRLVATQSDIAPGGEYRGTYRLAVEVQGEDDAARLPEDDSAELVGGAVEPEAETTTAAPPAKKDEWDE